MSPRAAPFSIAAAMVLADLYFLGICPVIRDEKWVWGLESGTLEFLDGMLNMLASWIKWSTCNVRSMFKGGPLQWFCYYSAALIEVHKAILWHTTGWLIQAKYLQTWSIHSRKTSAIFSPSCSYRSYAVVPDLGKLSCPHGYHPTVTPYSLLFLHIADHLTFKTEGEKVASWAAVSDSPPAGCSSTAHVLRWQVAGVGSYHLKAADYLPAKWVRKTSIQSCNSGNIMAETSAGTSKTGFAAFVSLELDSILDKPGFAWAILSIYHHLSSVESSRLHCIHFSKPSPVPGIQLGHHLLAGCRPNPRPNRQIMKSMLEYVGICWNASWISKTKRRMHSEFHAINAFKMPPVVWHPGPSWLRSAKIRRWMVEADTVLSNDGIHPLCLGFFSQLGLLWRFLNFGSLWPSFCCSTWITKYKTYQDLPLSDSRASRWLALDQVTHLTCACSADWNVLKQ